MCGIAGYIFRQTGVSGRPQIAALLSALRVRGPDDEGVVLIERSLRKFRSFRTGRSSAGEGDPELDLQDCGELPRHDVAFLHTRFAIIDPSGAGHQPFVTADGAVVLVFNGEIYNYRELRQELAMLGVVFRTSSDTEVLAEGFRVWKSELWPKLNGFWAAALYDRRDNSITLSRDRLGVAPLYYRWTKQGLFFCSLLRPLAALTAGGADINIDAVQGYVDTGIKDHDHSTFYRDIQSLPAACSWTIPARGPQDRFDYYWALPDRFLTAKDISEIEAEKRFRDLFMSAVELRLRADVPVAFELSGGLDSSSIVAAAAEISGRPLTAFSVRVRGRDETRYACSAAQFLSRRYALEHVVLEDLEDGFETECGRFLEIMEEPFDTPGNYIHNIMLKRIRSRGFKVVLTGAGGDETLAGYESAFWPKLYAEWQEREAGAGLEEGLFYQVDRYEFFRRYRNWERSLDTLKGLLRLNSKRRSTTVDRSFKTAAGRYAAAYPKMNHFRQRLYHFEIGLLPYYLRSTDHYTMNIPVEHRFPFLDFRLVEFGLRLPPEYLFRDGYTKYVLRRAMAQRLPADVVWRPVKMGFPFDFRGYFLPRAARFRKHFKALANIGFDDENIAFLAGLATTDPVRYWRALSAAMWVEQIICGSV